MSHIFRDPTEGATARRAELLRRRRDELVMMPHAIRRVYVARRARTAASLTVALLGGALLAIAMQPSWAQWIARGLPGINPAVLCTIVVAMWLAGLFAYVAARALDEHRFAVAMSRLVMPGADVNEDIERLAHEHPDQAARDMAHRLEVRSAALPVLAAGVLLPVTALYIGAALRAGGWPVIAAFETAVAQNARLLVVCGFIGAVTAIAMTRRALRLPVVAPGAAVLALIAGTGVAMAPTLLLAAIALLLMTVSRVARRLRIERELLQADDPAAGSEVFTLRGFVRQLRASLAPVVARVRSVRPVWVLIAGLLVIAGVTAMKLVEVREPRVVRPAAVAPAAISAPAALTTAIAAGGSRSTVETLPDGRIKITLALLDSNPIEVPALVGLASVPSFWKASVTFVQEEGLGLHVSVGDDGMQPLSIGSSITVTRRNCGMLEPLGLRVKGEPGHYVLYVAPVLTPAGC